MIEIELTKLKHHLIFNFFLASAFSSRKFQKKSEKFQLKYSTNRNREWMEFQFSEEFVIFHFCNFIRFIIDYNSFFSIMSPVFFQCFLKKVNKYFTVILSNEIRDKFESEKRYVIEVWRIRMDFDKILISKASLESFEGDATTF